MIERFENVTVLTEANVYFDGRCVSHTVILADGARKTLGVILPSMLTFSTGAPERMEIVAGRCRVRQAGSDSWQDYSAGQAFAVPGESRFDIEAIEPTHYVCHFG